MRRLTIFWFLITVLFLLIFGCAKPVKPVLQKNILKTEKIYPTTGYARDVFVSEHFVYVAQDQAGLILFNKSEGNIIWQKTNTIGDYITASESDSFMVAYEDNDFYFYNMTNPDSIHSFGGNYHEVGVLHPKIIEVNATRDTFKMSYYKSNNKQLKIYEYDYNAGGDYWTTNYINYILINFPTQNIKSYVLRDSTVFLAASQLGLLIVQYDASYEGVSGLEADVIGSEDTSGEALDVKIVDNYAYVADKQEGFKIIDISDVNNPTTISGLDTEGYAQSIDVTDDYLAVASGGGGVYIFDISDKNNPEFLDRKDDKEIGYTYKVLFHNGILFAATRNGVYRFSINP